MKVSAQCKNQSDGKCFGGESFENMHILYVYSEMRVLSGKVFFKNDCYLDQLH